MYLFFPKVVLIAREIVTLLSVHGVGSTVSEIYACTYHCRRIDTDNLQLWSCILLFHCLTVLFDYLTCNIVLHAVLDNHDVAVLNELAFAD